MVVYLFVYHFVIPCGLLFVVAYYKEMYHVYLKHSECPSRQNSCFLPDNNGEPFLYKFTVTMNIFPIFVGKSLKTFCIGKKNNRHNFKLDLCLDSLTPEIELGTQHPICVSNVSSRVLSLHEMTFFGAASVKQRP